jgi:hypothetical protein
MDKVPEEESNPLQALGAEPSLLESEKRSLFGRNCRVDVLPIGARLLDTQRQA